MKTEPEPSAAERFEATFTAVDGKAFRLGKRLNGAGWRSSQVAGDVRPNEQILLEINLQEGGVDLWRLFGSLDEVGDFERQILHRRSGSKFRLRDEEST